MSSSKTEFEVLSIKGLLSIWILSLLNKKKMNGYEIQKEIGDATGHYWEPKTGAVYPALHKLQKIGLISSTKGGSRHQIVYSLTKKGRKNVRELRKKVRNVHSGHKFRRMFEMLIWPDEADELRDEIDKLTESLTKLRNRKASEAEKVRRIRSAATELGR